MARKISESVVVTGASSGIGRATAMKFAKGGASLVLAARRARLLDEVMGECREMGRRALAVPLESADLVEERERVDDGAVFDHTSVDDSGTRPYP